MADLARTLSYVHSKRWLHNDIKQNNVVYHYSGGEWHVVLIDFGKATRLTDTSLTGNKVKDPKKYPWLAPEVKAGRRRSTASDVYSLGYLLKFILEILTKSKLKCGDMKTLSKNCRKESPSERPTVQLLFVSLRDLKF